MPADEPSEKPHGSLEGILKDAKVREEKVNDILYSHDVGKSEWLKDFGGWRKLVDAVKELEGNKDKAKKFTEKYARKVLSGAYGGLDNPNTFEVLYEGLGFDGLEQHFTNGIDSVKIEGSSSTYGKISTLLDSPMQGHLTKNQSKFFQDQSELLTNEQLTDLFLQIYGAEKNIPEDERKSYFTQAKNAHESKVLSSEQALRQVRRTAPQTEEGRANAEKDYVKNITPLLYTFVEKNK